MRGANGSRPYTPAEIEEVKAVAAAGGTLGSLAQWARAHGRSERSIYSLCKAQGIIHAGTKHRSNWTPEMEAKAIAMRDALIPIRAVAQTLGVATSTIHTHLSFIPRDRSKYEKPDYKRPAPAHQAKRRSCLCCGNHFHSAWIGHRLCNYCRNSHPAIGAVNYAI